MASIFNSWDLLQCCITIRRSYRNVSFVGCFGIFPVLEHRGTTSTGGKGEKGMVSKESEEEMTEFKSRSRIVKFIYLTTGLVFLGLGLLGMVLPVLPTTPFLLITTYCFAKGSSRFHQWFCHTHIYQKYLENYIRERAMTLKTKLSILIFASTVMMIAFVTIRVLPARCFLIAVMVFHWWYFFFRIKTK